MRKSRQATLDAQLVPLRTALEGIFTKEVDKHEQGVRWEIAALRSGSGSWVSMATRDLDGLMTRVRRLTLNGYGGPLAAEMMALSSEIEVELEGALEKAESAFADQYGKQRIGFFRGWAVRSEKAAAQAEIGQLRKAIAAMGKPFVSQSSVTDKVDYRESVSITSRAISEQKRFVQEHFDDAAWSYDPANPDVFRAALIARIEVHNCTFVAAYHTSKETGGNGEPWTMPGTAMELSDEHVETLARIARAMSVSPLPEETTAIQHLVDPDIDIQEALMELIERHRGSQEEYLKEPFGIREVKTAADVRYMLQAAVDNPWTFKDYAEDRGSRIEVKFSVPEDVIVELMRGPLADHVSLIRHIPREPDRMLPSETIVVFRGHMHGEAVQFLVPTRDTSNETLDALFGPGTAEEFSTTHEVKSVVREDAKTTQEIPRIACSHSEAQWILPDEYQVVPPTQAHRACETCHQPSLAAVPRHRTPEGREWLRDAYTTSPVEASKYLDATAALRILEGDSSIPRRPRSENTDAYYGNPRKVFLAEPSVDAGQWESEETAPRGPGTIREAIRRR